MNLKRDGIIKSSFFFSSSQNAKVKELLKSVHICPFSIKIKLTYLWRKNYTIINFYIYYQYRTDMCNVYGRLASGSTCMQACLREPGVPRSAVS